MTSGRMPLTRVPHVVGRLAAARTLALDAAALCTPGQSPLTCYTDAVQRGELESDAKQLQLMRALNRLHGEMETYRRPPPAGSGSSPWSWFTRRRKEVTAPRGLYVHGGVGCGKTLCMDMFYECSSVAPEWKTRVHFHEFMLGVHRRMHERRKAPDPLAEVSEQIGSATTLLCFDEMQVAALAQGRELPGAPGLGMTRSRRGAAAGDRYRRRPGHETPLPTPL